MADKLISGLNAASSVSDSDVFPADQTINSAIATRKVSLAQLRTAIGSSYTLPIATGSTLGGIKPDNSTVSVNSSTGVLSVIGGTGGGGSSYTLPAATTSTLGGVTTSTGITNVGGTISVTYGTTSGTAAQGNDSRITSAAPLNSPAFTGVPTAATAAQGTNTGQLATTQFVLGQSFLTTSTLPVGSSTVFGIVKPDGTTLTTSSGAISVTYGTAANTAAQGNDTRITGAAPLASPTFTGVPAGPTATSGTNTTQLATTAFVTGAVAASTTGVSSVIGRTGAITLANLVTDGVAAIGSSQTYSGNNTHSGTNAFTNSVTFSSAPTIPAGLTLYAPLASPTFTGTPAAPTATGGTNTTQIATTAFVTAAVSASTTGVSSVLGLTGAVTKTQLVSGGMAPLDSPTITGSPSIAGYLTSASASGTYAPKASPVFTGTADFTGASTVAATAGSSDNTTTVATTAHVKSYLASGATGTVYSGIGVPGFYYSNASGQMSVKANYPGPVFNVSVVDGMIIKWIAPVDVYLNSVTSAAIQLSGSNGYTFAVAVQGSSVAGLASVTTLASSGTVTTNATSQTKVTAGQEIIFQVSRSGTVTSGTGSNATFYLQYNLTYA